jgi:carboxyl-terminal processing protease
LTIAKEFLMRVVLTHPKILRFPKLLVLLPSVLALISCGGGGGGSSAANGGSATTLAPATTLARQCVAPRAGSADRTGTLDTEKAWVRSFMDETYLWYKDVPTVNTADFTLAAYGNSVYNTVDAYFEALKTKNTTASGKPVDQFSFTIPTAELQNLQSGISSGYGIRFTFISRTPPRVLRVLYVEPGSPAQLAGVSRGDTVLSIDGVDISDNTTTGIAKLNEGLSPTVASKTTAFGLLAANATAPRTANITSSQTIAVIPVPISTVIAEGTKSVGYLVLNSFSIASAEKQLVDAVTQLKAAKVNELVLDLRYNGGGFLDISNELGWMIGDATLAGKTFEKISCNDKNPFGICNAADTFQQTSLGFSAPVGQTLPQLGLQRVFVLTKSGTCSASESIINGLSPFMQVIRIGSTTCGKPYGFFYTDNCSTSYAAMQFKGENALGFGDYADGFAPTCPVADDLSKQRGDPAELMLSGALTYIRTGACPAVTTGTQKATIPQPLQGDFPVMRSRHEEIRLLGRPSGWQ